MDAKWLTFWLGIDETKSTTFVFMRNDAVQINLVKLLKYLAFW